MNKIFYKHYVFLENINKLTEDKLLKLNNVNIIINVNNNDKNSLDNENNLINFAKKKKNGNETISGLPRCFKPYPKSGGFRF